MKFESTGRCANWLFALLAAAVMAGCYPAEIDTGSARAILSWVPQPNPGLRGELSNLVDSVTVTVLRGSEVLNSASCDYEDYACTVSDIPAGSGRTLTAEAFNTASVLLYHGTAQNVKIAKDQTATVQVTMSPAYADDVYPPAAVDDLSASADGTDVLLSWTAVGDDDRAGQADSYDLRWSTSAISDANFDAANHVDAISPSPAGRAEQMPVKSLPPGTTYYFAIKVADDAGNISPLSNVPFADIQ